MKTLIIVTHPDIEKSAINKRWIEELKKSPKNTPFINYIKLILMERSILLKSKTDGIL
jgi:putative NADPH-quinone reductase